MTDLLAHLVGVSCSGEEWTVYGPALGDQHRTLSLHYCGSHWLLKCHAGYNWEQIMAARRVLRLRFSVAQILGHSRVEGNEYRCSACCL